MERRTDLVGIGLGIYGVSQLLIAAFQVIDPRTFYDEIGPFGAFNEHYLGDTAAFVAGPAIAALLAIRRPSWRVPILFAVLAQTAFHAINHLVDIGEAEPESVGVVDFVALFVGVVLLAGLLRYALRDERA